MKQPECDKYVNVRNKDKTSLRRHGRRSGVLIVNFELYQTLVEYEQVTFD